MYSGNNDWFNMDSVFGNLRKKNSLTQDELAKCLGVSKRTIIGWERDGRYPRNVEILEKMADAVQFIHELLHGRYDLTDSLPRTPAHRR